jgi:hypothetical protein
MSKEVNMSIYVFHTGILLGNPEGPLSDEQLWYTYFDGENWTPDTLIPSVGIWAAPSAVAWAGGITVFHQGPGDGQLWYSYSPDGTSWGEDTLVPNVGIGSPPSAVVFPGGGLSVFHQGLRDGYGDGQLWYSYFDGQNWAPDTLVPNVGMSYWPSAVAFPGGGLSVFHQGLAGDGGGDGQLWYSYFDGTNWAPDTLVPNVGIGSAPSAVVFPGGGLSVFHEGGKNLWYSYFDGADWAPDTLVPNVGITNAPSAVVLPGGGLSVFHSDVNQSGQLWYSYFDGTNWAPDTLVPNEGFYPSAVVY